MQRVLFSDGVNTLELEHILEITGFGTPPVDLTSTPKGWRQDGASVQWAAYQSRPFTISFDVRADNYEAAAAERRAVIRFFADKTAKQLIYTRKDFQAYLYPVYLAGPYDTPMRETRVLTGALQFIAANPWFKRDMAASSAMIEIPVLEYPAAGLEYPAAGIEYSSAETGLLVSNPGDVDADALIRFIGPATTPYVENTATGQRIEVSRELAAGEVLEINSASGRVDIIDTGGTRHNAFNFITEDSSFITLVPGENRIEYGSAGGALGYIEIGGTEYYAGV